eukprot:tig00021013_g17067.t1
MAIDRRSFKRGEPKDNKDKAKLDFEREWSILRPFLPLNLIARHNTNPTPVHTQGEKEPDNKADFERFAACLLFCDIKGFTALMEKHSALGNAGIEQLSNVISSTFGPQIDTIHRFMGDVICVDGDALIVMFREERNIDTVKGKDGLFWAVVRGAQCALALVSQKYPPAQESRPAAAAAAMRKMSMAPGSKAEGSMYNRRPSLEPGAAMMPGGPGGGGEQQVLLTKVSVGAGEVVAIQAGMNPKNTHVMGSTFPGRKFYMIGGAPLTQIGEIEHLCGSNQVVTSRFVWRDVGLSSVASGTPIQGQTAFRLESITDLPIFLASDRPVAASCTPEALPMLQTFVPYAVRTRLSAAVGNGFVLNRGAWMQANWLAEFRVITSVFVQLGVDFTGPAPRDGELAELVQKCTIAIQKVVYRQEGSLQSLVVDDKGCIALVAFGLPPFSHKEDPLRAAQ